MNVSKVSKDCIMHTQTGTPYYASPEVWKDIPYDIKSDVWSLGCVLYESASLKPPFQADNMEGLYKKVIKGEYNSIPKCFSIELSHVIYGMLQVNPNYRFSCAQILSLPSVVKHMNGNPGDNEYSLLQTIKFPKNFNMISKNLPEPNYIQMKPVRNKSTIMPNVRKDITIMRNASESKSRKNLIKNDSESPGGIKRSFIKENYKLIHLHRAGQILKKYSAKSLIPRNDPAKGEIFIRKPGTNRSLVLPGY
jgi:NIMA (never in mitosis gene a)-related kinase